MLKNQLRVFEIPEDDLLKFHIIATDTYTGKLCRIKVDRVERNTETLHCVFYCPDIMPPDMEFDGLSLHDDRDVILGLGTGRPRIRVGPSVDVKLRLSYIVDLYVKECAETAKGREFPRPFDLI